MIKSSLRIVSLLRNEKNSLSDTNKIISYVLQIGHVLVRRATDKNHFFVTKDSKLIEDLINDSIIPLFLPDKSNIMPIQKSYLTWDKKIHDEASANYFLYKIVSCRLEQEFFRKLKEADPFFSKILRSFNHLVETGRINKTEWFGVSYLISKEEIKLAQKPIDPELIENLPSLLFQGRSEKIITSIFKYLEEETNYCRAVPLNALIRKVKHVNASFLQNTFSDSLNESFDEKLDIELIVNSSINSVNNRIEDFYYKKGKFTYEESEIVKRIIKEFSVDLQDGGISRGMFEYISPYLPNLTKEHFYNKYHQPLDYLLRLLKKEIASRLEEPNN